ncbi:unnamed protein product, partial [Nesidiocoris tenuis]
MEEFSAYIVYDASLNAHAMGADRFRSSKTCKAIKPAPREIRRLNHTRFSYSPKIGKERSDRESDPDQ